MSENEDPQTGVEETTPTGYVNRGNNAVRRLTLDATDHPIVTLEIEISEGTLWVMAEVAVDPENRTVLAQGLHVHGEGFESNSLGYRRLRQIVQYMLEELEYDGCIIEGGMRPTGASPGRQPKQLRFKRRRDPVDVG
jgi:hypothetical protein